MITSAMSSCASMRAGGLLLFLLFMAVPAAAEVPELRTVRSQFYTIHTNLPDDQLRPYARHMDQTYDAFAQRFSRFRAKRRDKPDLYLFAQRDEYNAYLKTRGFDASSTGGLFFVRAEDSGLATWVNDRPMQSTLQTLQHEGFHQFAYEHIGTGLPLWVNEGLAVYFEQARLVKGKMKTGLAEHPRVVRLKAAANDEELLGFEELLTIDSATWFANMQEGERGSLQYLQAWSVVYFLIHADGGKYRTAFEAYLQGLAKGHPHDKAFEDAFKTDRYTTFANRWQDFIEDDLEADAYTTGIDRMEFLASGVLALHASGRDVPGTLNDLQEVLQRAQYRLAVRSHGGELTYNAADEALYTYTDRRGREHRFATTVQRSGPGKGLPSIEAPELKFSPSIRWVTRGGKLAYDVVYD